MPSGSTGAGSTADDGGTEPGTSGSTSGGSTDEDTTEGSESSGDSTDTGMTACEGVADLGDMLPVLELGDTVAEDNSYAPTCFPQCASDAAFSWTAPAAGIYTIDTLGSAYDTGLYVYDGCGKGPELACNDDVFGVQSAVFVDLAAGQLITIIVDGYGLEEGPFQLNIQAGMAYDCVGPDDCSPGEYCFDGTCWPFEGGGSSDGGWGGTGGTSGGGWGGTSGGGWVGTDSGGWGGPGTGGGTAASASASVGGGWGGTATDGGGGVVTGVWGGGGTATDGGWGGTSDGGWGGTSDGGWGGTSDGGWGGSDSGGGSDGLCEYWE